MDSLQERLIDYLAGLLTESRLKRIDEVIELRTRHFTVVLEDVYKEQNASAVVRTCECLGLQDLHIIENNHQYNVNPDVVLGSEKWVDIIRYNSKPNNTPDAYEALRRTGYRIIATAPSKNATPVHELDIDDKAALVFGTEYDGLSDYALENADYRMALPLYGFTESYNLSVSVAIGMSYLVAKLRNSGVEWNLSDEEKKELKLNWIRRTIRRSEALEEEFLKSGK